MAVTAPILDGIGDTDYERYIRVSELLSLQKPSELLAHPDERLFQITHQAAELWLKQVEHEISRIERFLDERELDLATGLFSRCTMILELLRDQIVILETMAPVDYHQIRVTSLGRGSGQESPGFKRLLQVGTRIWPRFGAVLAEQGITPLDIEREPRRFPALFGLVQAMMGYDSAFMKWRFVHLKLAERVIGSKVSSLKGIPVNQLEAGTKEALFPLLWDAINDLTGEYKPAY